MSIFDYFWTSLWLQKHLKVVPFCSQTFLPEDADQKVDHHWSDFFVHASTERCSLLKCLLAKHCFPEDVEQNLTQQEEKHETPLWHKETQSRFKAGLRMRSLAGRETQNQESSDELWWQYFNAFFFFYLLATWSSKPFLEVKGLIETVQVWSIMERVVTDSTARHIFKRRLFSLRDFFQIW